MGSRFVDRRHAGRVLAERLTDYCGRTGLLVLGLARGGVPVAAEVARTLGAPLDVVVVRKVGVPDKPELAMGALALVGGVIETVRNEDVIAELYDGDRGGDAFEEAAARERAELTRREDIYRMGRDPVEVAGRVVVVVDDGLATGATMRAAVAAVRRKGPARVVVAVPVGDAVVCEQVATVADQLVCAYVSRFLWAVGQAYEHFQPTTDDEVRQALASSDD